MISRRIILAFCLITGCFIGASHARAAVLYTVPETQMADPADTVTLDVRLNSEKDIVNAVQARILFDPAALEVIQVSKASSFLVLWTEQPTVDAKAGVISFSGGVPNGSYVVNGRLVTIVFRSKHLGSTSVLFDTGTSGVYLNDGLGTKAALTAKPATIDVALTGRNLTINSSTHPDPDSWYASSFLQFDWNVSADSIYAYILNEDPTVSPDTRFGSAVREAMYSNIKDGAYWFILQEKLPNDKWGSPIKRRVLVDTQPPNEFTPQVTRDVVPGKLAITFNASDATSSVVRYRIQEGQDIYETTTTPYILRDQYFRSDIRITAIDAAGNERSEVVSAEPIAAPNSSKQIWLISGILAAVFIVFLGVFLVRRRRTA